MSKPGVPFQLVWLRNDLRCYDNAALYFAAEAAQRLQQPLVVLFAATKDSWQAHDMAPIKQDFIRRRVQALQQELAQLNIPLLAIEASDYASMQPLFQLLADLGMAACYAHTEYELREQHRDHKITALLAARGIACFWYDKLCVMPPGSIKTQSGDVYKVFTPFKRNWLHQLEQRGITCLKRPQLTTELAAITEQLKQSVVQPLATAGFPALLAGDNSSADWPVAEHQVLEQMRLFCQQQVADYQQQRDFPAKPGTSKLSAYLAIGVLSAQQCVSRLQLEAATQLSIERSGAAVWLSELIWREFYKHILVAFPDLIKHRPFQAETAAIRWPNDPALFNAWCQGNTGYPIVDAAMRQLNQTGWMHNRLRMIAASFLVKDLHVDWRLGEQYFMSRLIDGDFAANNGGWQWAASTGTDAAPYFRIFNPVTQSERFDPAGDFIKGFIPELNKLDAKSIHWPHKVSTPKGYAKPVVDHAAARIITLALFKEVKQ
ncbi:deoxyribodipyrimidine photo-lyase [Arsukibacterium sp.]|uniref:deoxyribodipyrimidine photo-lyase n=1 Tax=Arsukibacterium sp. TaxID=1977258 RepID=UPI002FDB94BE